MPKLSPLPLKPTEWRKLRKSGSLLVDKTLDLDSLVIRYNPCYIARPHGMGKTMLCAQLEELFTNGPKAFAGMDIHDEWDEDTYPVVRLSLGESKRVSVSKYAEWLQKCLIKAYVQAGLVKKGELEVQDDLEDLLSDLSTAAAGQELVFLIDDWDAQILHYLHDEDASSYLESLWQDFWEWLRDNNELHFVLVTGTMSYYLAKEVLGDCEPINVEPDHYQLLGITPEELTTYYGPYLTEAAQRLGLSEDELITKLESYYLGFNFDLDEPHPVYSPLDLNQFFAPLTESETALPEFKPYWFASRDHYGLERWIKGEYTAELVEQLDQEIEIPGYYVDCLANFDELDLPTYLFETGYLTFKTALDGLPETVVCPNRAIAQGLTKLLER